MVIYRLFGSLFLLIVMLPITLFFRVIHNLIEWLAYLTKL